MRNIFKGPHFWVPKPLHMMVGIDGWVVAILRDAKSGLVRQRVEGPNIVTDDGDIYYAERGALLTTGTPIGPVPTNFTDTNGLRDMIMEYYDNTPTNNAPDKAANRSDLLGTLATGSGQGMDTAYPLVNDSDPDNTGAGVDIITYRVSYATGDGNQADNTDVILTNPSPGASEPVITHAEFGASFTKTSADTLKVFINHRMNGI